MSAAFPAPIEAKDEAAATGARAASSSSSASLSSQRSPRPPPIVLNSVPRVLPGQLETVQPFASDSEDDDNESFASVPEESPSPKKPPRLTLLGSPRRTHDTPLVKEDGNSKSPRSASGSGAVAPRTEPVGPVPGVADPSRQVSGNVIVAEGTNSLGLHPRSMSGQGSSTPRRSRTGSLTGFRYSVQGATEGSPTPNGKLAGHARHPMLPVPQSPTQSYQRGGLPASPGSPLRLVHLPTSEPTRSSLGSPSINVQSLSKRASQEGIQSSPSLSITSPQSIANGDELLSLSAPVRSSGTQTAASPSSDATQSPSVASPPLPWQQAASALNTASNDAAARLRRRADSVYTGSGAGLAYGSGQSPALAQRARAGTLHSSSSSMLRSPVGNALHLKADLPRLASQSTPRSPSPWALGELRGGIGGSHSPFSAASDLSLSSTNADRDEMHNILTALRSAEFAGLDKKIEQASRLREIFVKSANAEYLRNEFRNLGGFLTLVQVLSTMTETADDDDDDDDDKRLRLELLALALAILHESLNKHIANQRMFEKQIGWRDLQAVINLTGLARTNPWQLFALLLGFATGKVVESIDHFSDIEKAEVEFAGSGTDASSDSTADARWDNDLAQAGVLSTIIWLLREDAVDSRVQCRVLSVIQRMATTNKRNQCAMVDAKISSTLLEARWPESSTQDSISFAILTKLYELGLPVYDGRKLVRRLDMHMNCNVLKMLTQVAGPSSEPNHISFDMRHGHSSMVMAMLRRPFPPPATSAGFTFMSVVRIDAEDPHHDVEVLHLFDPQRICFVRLVVDPDDGAVVYTTRHGTPPIRFANTPLPTGRWHHICLSHARPRDSTTRSRVRLHINGALVDEQIGTWPEASISNASIRAMFGSPPLDVTPDGPQTANKTIWSLGTAYLLDDILPPDVPLVLSELALSGYSGNYQDSLGRFLTYSTSTRINVALDLMTRQDAHAAENVANNPLVHAITGPSRRIVREEKLFFVLNPANLSSLSRVMGPRSAVARRESVVKRDTVFDSRFQPAQEVVLNQAITLTRDAMDMSYGYAKLYGDPIISIPYPLADTFWRLGGCAILLRLIERADDYSSFEYALTLFLQLVSSSWRLSEEVEHSKGFEILNYLLSRKRQFLSVRILELLTDAVGLKLSESWINAALANPFLYRVILLDFSLWQSTNIEVQIAHLDQIDAFMRHSQLKRFNAKRVAKMQIARKLLFALEMQGANIDEDLSTRYIATLRNVLIASFNDAAIRAVSSFVAAHLCRRASRSKSQRLPLPRKQNTMAVVPTNSSITTSLFGRSTEYGQESLQDNIKWLRQVAVLIFKMLSELVLDRPPFLLKLSSAINIKWLLVFFGPGSDPVAAQLSLDILTTLLVREPRYAERLTRTGGFKVMERLLPRYWAAPGVLDLCWVGLFGLHSRLLPKEARTNKLAFLIGEMETNAEKIVIARPLMLRLVLACLSEALHELSATRSLRDEQLPRFGESTDAPLSAAKSGEHIRQRSQSVHVDVRNLALDAKMGAHVELLQDNVRFIEKLTQSSKAFRDLLFTPANLRIFVGAITAQLKTFSPVQYADRSSAHSREAIRVINKRLLDVLALAAVEGMTAAGSAKGVDAIVEALPPHVDLDTATAFRLTFYESVVIAIKDIVVPGLGDVLEKESCQAIASFIEQSSGEVETMTILDLTATLLNASAPRRFPDVLASLYTSLNRIILFRLAQRASEVYGCIERHASIIFSAHNQDPAFFHCLLHNLLKDLHDRSNSKNDAVKIAGYSLLQLMASATPELVQSIMIDPATIDDLTGATEVEDGTSKLMGGIDVAMPFLEEWEGFVKSNDSLKAAIHLDRMSRVKLSLDKSDERQKAIMQTEARMVAWQHSVLITEETRIAKFRTDLREMTFYTSRQWQTILYPTLKSERAVLGQRYKRIFELDPIEGPLRMRAKLKEAHTMDIPDVYHNDLEMRAPEMAKTVSASSVGEDAGNTAIEGDFVEEPETGTVESTPTNEADASLALSDEAAETHDDKYRRVIRSLEKGDVIEGVENSLRVVFIECRASLLIFGKRCFYIVDDYFQRPDGELCNLWEAPEEERDSIVMSTLGTSTTESKTLVRQLEGDAHKTRHWRWAELRLVTQKTFLHRKTAVEISFHDGQTCLLVLATTEQADAVFQSLSSRNRAAVQAFDTLLKNVRVGGSASSGTSTSVGTGHRAARANGSAGNSSGGFSKLADVVLGRGPGSITQRWIERKISNFDYLMCLNTAAGRTYQDITQYPIMPFILCDYNSSALDLDDPASYRDLSLPMGAQTEWRRKQFEERYVQLAEMKQVEAESTVPFHYGTHYSTAATVSGFLIRLQPFDKIVKALQGGSFDLADRLFSSIGQAYSSASAGSLGDVRELIPEAFYCPEFLVNTNNFDFGTTQSGSKVGDVELPPWAKGDPRLFIELHRQALESDYVSQNLHQWIDLIFGFKQRGEAAVEATNVFHELSYEDGLDLHSFESPMERQAALKTVHMFGVCPRQLFQAPHPQRHPPGPLRPSLKTTPWLLVQSALPARTLKSHSVQFIYTADDSSRPFASPKDYLVLPHVGLSISTGHLDNSVRFYVKENLNSPKSAIEMVLPERVSCIVDASGHVNTLGGPSDLEFGNSTARVLLGGLGGTVVACQVDVPRRDITFVHACRGHSDAIMCLAYSHAWSLSVSGSQDTTAIIWDSEGRYVKTLEHDGPVQAVRICARNGVIATASGKMLHLWSINGDRIASVTTSATDPITCLAFSDETDGVSTSADNGSHEGAIASLGLVLTGHRGRVILWRCRAEGAGETQKKATWILEPYHLLMQRQNEVTKDDMPATPSKPLPLITAVKVLSDSVVTGDESGKLYTWSLPGEAPHIDVASSSKPQLHGLCMQCSRKFGVFDKRIACAGCGGTFCTTCALSLAGSPFGTQHRFCTSCRDILALQVGRWATMAGRHDTAMKARSWEVRTG